MTARIGAAIRESGITDSAAGALAGASAQSVHLWKRQYPEFAESLAAARSAFRRDQLEAIRTASSRDVSRDWRALETPRVEETSSRPARSKPGPHARARRRREIALCQS